MNLLLKNFQLNAAVRIIFIAATIFLASIVYFIGNDSVFAIVLIIFVAIQSFFLFRYVSFTNRELARFLMAIKYSDFSQTFNRGSLGGSFKELGEAFDEVITKFHETKREKEEHYKYLQTVTQHVGVGLISFNQEGKIELLNNSAKKILKVNYLKNINDLPESKKELLSAFQLINRRNKKLVKINDDNGLVQISIYSTEFKLRDQVYKLVAFQNIQNELEEKEMEAWQKLIRILTHEIMNSVTPISSLSATLAKILDEAKREEKNPGEETFNDLVEAANTIHKRSEGLISFVDKYRKLTRIPKPDFKIVLVEKLFIRIKHLFDAEIIQNGIEFSSHISPPSLEVTADAELIEQVLINLLLNAIHAVQGKANAKVELTSRLDEQGRVVIQVRDNGTGIAPDVQEKIFIPFFTTKKEGSGIGLSLSRQIMRIHGGTIGVTSIPDVQTTFTLRF